MSDISPKIGIVTIGYNRVDCISRLLNRLNDCDYPSEDIPLVISLDNCGKDDVLNYCTEFEWLHGEKTVIHQPQRLGLKKHVLKCGSYIEEFDWDAAIVLEDDVYTAAPFYKYAQQAVEFYKDDDRIAGIALYSLTQNQTVRYPFSAELSDYDACFIQLAQSLGQVWMRRQWKAFAEWYEKNDATFTECPNVPFNVCRWPETSWLKYHIRYCVEENKYFVYPYQSLTTNFGDVGTHNSGKKLLALQTPLQQTAKTQYNFPVLGENGVMYDAWCENLAVADSLGLEDVCVDLYGAKKNYAGNRYWLTPLSRPYKIVKSFGMELRPIDMNVLCNLPGNELFLYDTQEEAPAPNVADRDVSAFYYYNNMLYPDEAIRKIAAEMREKNRKSNAELLLHPVKLSKKIISKLK